MNRVFKTKWSVAHQEYVVTDEKHTTKTKSTKSAVALAVAAMMFAAGTASASFVDTSFVADNPSCSSRPRSRLKRLNTRRTGASLP